MKRWRLGPADLLAGFDAHGPCTAWVKPGGTAPAAMRVRAVRPGLRARRADDGHAHGQLVDWIERWLEDPASGPDTVPDGPPFMRECWRQACRIDPGTTVSYGILARMAGRPGAARAAAQAMARNRMAPLVPCHRVVSSSGLGGFMGVAESVGDSSWELGLKRWLLAREGASDAR